MSSKISCLTLFFALFNVSRRVIKSFHLNEKPWQISGKHDLRAKSSSPFRQLRGASSHIPAPLSSASSSLYIYIRALRGPFGSAWADAYTRACRRDKTDVSALNAQPVSISFSINLNPSTRFFPLYFRSYFSIQMEKTSR